MGAVATISDLKVAELQRRGLVHFHAVVRADGPVASGGAATDPPEWLTAELVAHQLTALIGEVRLHTAGATLEWGTQFDVAILAAGDTELTEDRFYVAKYAVKTTDGSAAFARRFGSRGHITRTPGSPHLKRLATTSWDLGATPACRCSGCESTRTTLASPASC